MCNGSPAPYFNVDWDWHARIGGARIVMARGKPYDAVTHPHQATTGVGGDDLYGLTKRVRFTQSTVRMVIFKFIMGAGIAARSLDRCVDYKMS